MQNTNAYQEKPPIVDDGAPPQYQYSDQANVPVQHVIVRQPPLTNPPKDYLVQAILVTVCCFWPTGIVAIIKALDVQRAAATGDSYLAETSSAAARKFVNISFFVGLGLLVVTVILCVLYVILLAAFVGSTAY